MAWPVHYRGFTIHLERQPSLGGWSAWYYTVVRKRDGWYALDDLTESNDTRARMLKMLRARIDAELEAKEWEA